MPSEPSGASEQPAGRPSGARLTVRCIRCYHDHRNGGSVVALRVTTSVGKVVVIANWGAACALTDAEVKWVLAHDAGHASIDHPPTVGEPL
jgi:hypothetical protein